MKNLAIIPARSGSKGLKDKNIKPLNNKPLLAYSIEAARESNIFDEIMVSTDSQEYADIAVQWGASVPFLRSIDLSSDTASSWDVIKDVIVKYKDLGKIFDTVTFLQPTSPLRTSKNILDGYELLKNSDGKLVVGVCEMDHSPLWANVLPDNLSMENFIKPDVIKIPRQSLKKYYRINGALYIIKVEHLMKTSDIYGDKSFALVMQKEHSVDIDDNFDFIVAEALMNKKKESMKDFV